MSISAPLGRFSTLINETVRKFNQLAQLFTAVNSGALLRNKTPHMWKEGCPQTDPFLLTSTFTVYL